MDESKWHKTLPPSVSVSLIVSLFLPPLPLSLYCALKLMAVFVCLWTQRWLVIRLNGRRQPSASGLLVPHKLPHLLGGPARRTGEGEEKEVDRNGQEEVVRKDSREEREGRCWKNNLNSYVKKKLRWGKSLWTKLIKRHKNCQSVRASSVSSCEKQTIQLPTEWE